MRPWPPPRKVRKHFLTRQTVKNGISNLNILLKSALKMQEMPFQRPKFQNGISNLYILCKSALKMQEMPFQRPKFQKISRGACPRTPLQLCHHYGLPLTKILATPLYMISCYTIRIAWQTQHIFLINHISCFQPLSSDSSPNLNNSVDRRPMRFYATKLRQHIQPMTTLMRTQSPQKLKKVINDTAY